ncbi:hypothetical protein DPMN_125495 [Dreissena polymorpha]|uniref:Uncharacterized protein n=1 Tax=Dreissena polymorpha TaxID=45954 RepID=A0A9D4H1J0_DREPO|nr:hypothetical protein DPMN_125495 [Dreissena polymorpha]
MLKHNIGWAWPMWAGRPMIDRIVIKKVQYQFEVNRCRHEEVIVKGNFGRPWDVQYSFEVNWRGTPALVMGPCIYVVEIDRIVIRNVQFQFEVKRCRNEKVKFQGSSANSDERTDGQTAEITT